MRTYTEAFKKGVVAKALLKPGISPRQTAKEVGVSSSAMYIWIKQYGSESPINRTLPKAKPTDWSKAEQFNILLATAHLSDEARGAYCRQRGLYQHQLDQWREVFMKEKEASTQSKELAELRALRAENKALKKELTRKEKALAEASALLLLKKKAGLIWGEHGDD